MRNDEVRACDACGGGLSGGHGTPLVGARLTVQRLIINKHGFEQHVGLETYFGGGVQGRVLADVIGLGSGNAIDEPPMLRDEVIICETCLLPVLIILETVRHRAPSTVDDAIHREEAEA